MPDEGWTRGFLQFLKVGPCLGRPREQKAPGVAARCFRSAWSAVTKPSLAGGSGTKKTIFIIWQRPGKHPGSVIGCCDSRVSPEIIFDAEPGELFVLRNIANLVPPYGPNDDLHGTSAALEFGVMGLGVEHIVMMGHAGCGGWCFRARRSQRRLSAASPGDFIGKWISLIKPAAARTAPAGAPPDDYIERLALASIVQGLANLRTFPWIAEREQQGKLGLHGA
jgi:carbonic anhydrase